MSDDPPKEDAKPPEKKSDQDGGDKKQKEPRDLFTGLLIVAGVLLALVLAVLAVAEVESYQSDNYGGKGSDSERARAFREAADMVAEVEYNIDRVIDAERTGEAVRRVHPHCVDPAARFTATVLAKIRGRLEDKAKRASRRSAGRRRGWRGGGCDWRAGDSCAEPLK
jgi:hypothetical protein